MMSVSSNNWTDEDLIRERGQEIEDICQDINDIKEIFTDLSALVTSQEEIIEQIDENSKEALDKTKQGIMHLVKASEYQKSAFSLSLGIIAGAIVGGPAGAVAGLKLYSFVTAIGGSIIGGIATRYI